VAVATLVAFAAIGGAVAGNVFGGGALKTGGVNGYTVSGQSTGNWPTAPSVNVNLNEQAQITGGNANGTSVALSSTLFGGQNGPSYAGGICVAIASSGTGCWLGSFALDTLWAPAATMSAGTDVFAATIVWVNGLAATITTSMTVSVVVNPATLPAGGYVSTFLIAFEFGAMPGGVISATVAVQGQ